ncbi:MAG TPA: sulfotransferase, partial [Actinomycetota bacterium]|nr:sulfotransferase [Actinomycetota bacterium]
PTKVIYVLGPGRSGSGILGRTLSTIPGAAFVGELRRAWRIRPDRTCACGRPHAECPVWSKLLVPGSDLVEPARSEMARLQDRVAPARLGWWTALRLRGLGGPPGAETPAGRYLEAYTRLHRAIAAATGASLLIDSSKSAADAALLALRPEVPTFLVQLMRDPRGVVSSLQRHAGRRSWVGRRALAVRGAVRWVAKHLANEALRRRVGPERSIAIRYEDLVQDPQGTVEAVAKLTGSAVPLAPLGPGAPIPVPEVHEPEGSRRRRFEPAEIVLELDTRWHRELGRLDRWLVTALTFPLLRSYGYPVRVAAR